MKNDAWHIYHCEALGCTRRELKLCVVDAAAMDGSHRHRWLCPLHRDQPGVRPIQDVIGQTG